LNTTSEKKFIDDTAEGNVISFKNEKYIFVPYLKTLKLIDKSDKYNLKEINPIPNNIFEGIFPFRI